MRRRTAEVLVLGVLIGAAAGIGGYTFVYAKGYSYLSNDPAACANCHVMAEEYSGWTASSHRAVATCNDCHAPSGFLAKYANKASNGFWHSFGFTSGRFHEPIQIKPHNAEITERACRKCHADIVAAIEWPSEGPSEDERSATSCVRCHRNVGHLH